jgi:hypothetical protein
MTRKTPMSKTRHRRRDSAPVHDDAIRISSKNLAALAMPTHCDRCFWTLMRCRFRTPFSIFPGVFSTFDVAIKRLVQAWFDRHGELPGWLSGLGPVAECIEPPHFSKFQLLDKHHDILLTGVADAILRRVGGSYLIGDYKVARYTDHQDELLPLYRCQLNCYALIAEACGLSPVSGLALIYLEPRLEDAPGCLRQCRDYGLDMAFDAHVVDIDLDREMVDPLLEKARRIHDLPVAPAGREGCKECALTVQLASVTG